MTLWNISGNVVQLLESNYETGILKILKLYPPEQKRFIVAIKNQDSSLLFRAVKNQLSSVVIYFLENCGADPNSFGFLQTEKITCIAIATFINSEILVRTLLYYGADTEIVFSSNEITVLFYACTMGRFEIVKILIEQGANLNHQDSQGYTCLMACMHNLELFRLLVSAGADINVADKFGKTCLVLALKSKKHKLVTFLLGLEETKVRLSVDSECDTLCNAVHYSRPHVIQKVIKKGSYTTEYIATVNELESCRNEILNSKEKARKLWQVALKLRGKPVGTPMFETPHRVGKLKEVINFFHADDIQPLLFLESMSGFSLNTAYMYVLAAWNVEDPDNYIQLCKFFFKEMHFFEDRYFFRILESGITLANFILLSEPIHKTNVLEVFNMLVNYIEEIYIRLYRMTMQDRSVYGCKIDLLMGIIVMYFYHMNRNLPEDISWLFNSINRLLRLDLRGFCQKTLLQKCAINHGPLVARFFLAHKANVNSSDRLGKTVLNDLVETLNVSPNVISSIIDYGFDFHAVKYVEYCLSCRLRNMSLLPNPAKHTSLQCLAAKAFCENKMRSFNEVPGHLMTIVKSHLYN